MELTKLTAGAMLAGVATWIALDPLSGDARATDPQDAAGQEASMVSPEHKLLEKWAGKWEASVKMSGPADTPPVATPGTSTSRVGCGGLWLVTDFETTIMGMPFVGHETLGYDPTAKKYVLTWVDSMSTSFVTGEGTFDAKSNTMTFLVKGRDMTGAAASWRQTDVWKDANTREWSMWKQSPDGKDALELQITYHRK